MTERTIEPTIDLAEHAGEIAAHEPPSAVQTLAARLRCTEGQLYSMAISLTAATALVLAGGVPLGDAPQQAALPGPTTNVPTPPVVVVPTPQASPPPLGQLPIGGQATPLVPTPDPVPTGSPLPSPPPVQFPSLLSLPAPGMPRAFATDGSRVFAGTDNSGTAPSQLFVYTAAGRLTKKITITGQPKDHTGGLTAAAVHGSRVLVSDRSRGALIEIDPITGRQQHLATIPNVPPCLIGITGTCQPGVQDLPATPEGLVVAGKYAYVSDAGQGTIWRYDFTTKKLTAWYSSPDFSLSGPSGLGIDTSGSLLLTVADSADVAALHKGALYRLAVAADGKASTRTLVASFADTDRVGSLAVGRADDAYVALRGTGGVAVVSRAGKVESLSGGSASQLPVPTGLSLVDGTLLVVDQGKPATSTSGRVVAVPVEDGPAF